jgi:alkylhydroperoxidase family enzyme
VNVTRIAPLEAPFEPETQAALNRMMPTGVPPIALFRTFAHNLSMTEAMHGWGSYELGKTLSLSRRDREIVIDRTCARCGCEYEWGVHVAMFAERAALDRAQVASLTHGTPDDPCWTSERDRLLIRAVDALHEGSDIPHDLWTDLYAELDREQFLDLTMLCGWYHAVSFTARAARVPLENFAPRFASVAATRVSSSPSTPHPSRGVRGPVRFGAFDASRVCPKMGQSPDAGVPPHPVQLEP